MNQIRKPTLGQQEDNGDFSRRVFLRLAGVSGLGMTLPPLVPTAEGAVGESSLEGAADVAGFPLSSERLHEISGLIQWMVGVIAELHQLDIPDLEPAPVYRVPRA